MEKKQTKNLSIELNGIEMLEEEKLSNFHLDSGMETGGGAGEKQQQQHHTSNARDHIECTGGNIFKVADSHRSRLINV